MRLVPMGEEPQLAPPIPQAFAQREQMEGGQQRVAAMGQTSNAGVSGGTGAGAVHSAAVK